MDIFSETPVQAIYELSAPSTNVLRINIYKPAFEIAANLLDKDPPIISFDKKDNSRLVAEPKDSKEWGVRGILELTDSPDPNWCSLDCDISMFGDKERFTHERGYTVSNCLQLLLRHLLIIEVEGDPDRLQLIYQPALNIGTSNASLSCWLLPSFTAWLRKNPNKLLKDVGQKMAKAFGLRSGLRTSVAFSEIGISISRDGYPSISCPGNACDFSVYPDTADTGMDGLWQMGCHNVDSVHQQMCLLYGLACLHDLARADGH